jgi:aldose 1-epimerase
LLVPADLSTQFEEDVWPKQGAFPMLPFSNKLHEARFYWDGIERNVRAVPGQNYGLHGFAHRCVWRVESQEVDRVQLIIDHEADSIEWPWSFVGRLEYALSSEGLSVRLEICNDSSTSMPAVLGWHPYVPSAWLKDGISSGVAVAMHGLDKNGNCEPETLIFHEAGNFLYANLSRPHTVAIQNLSSPWTVQLSDGMTWCLTADAKHLVHHVPNDLAYACIEPVTALPGSLSGSTITSIQTEVYLQPAERRRLTCRLSLTE